MPIVTSYSIIAFTIIQIIFIWKVWIKQNDMRSNLLLFGFSKICSIVSGRQIFNIIPYYHILFALEFYCRIILEYRCPVRNCLCPGTKQLRIGITGCMP